MQIAMHNFFFFCRRFLIFAVKNSGKKFYATGALMLITLLKSDVTRRDHVVRCHGSHECWFTHRQFHSQFHSRRHSLRITLKWCACAVVTREPRNRDNGASDVWALTAYF